MVNAWSLLASELDGTMDEDYPIKLQDDCYPTLGSIEHSDYYYDYNRHDINLDNPFTDLKDREKAEKVVGKYPRQVWPKPTKKELQELCKEVNDLHIQANSPYNDGWTQDFYKEELKKGMTANYYKYHEEEILKDIEEYVSGTYRGHYTGDTHEYRNVQTIDLMAARSLASSFCQSNIIKYGSRYGSKDGKEKKDLLKVIHYAMLLLHFDEHYGKPKITTGNIDHTMP